MRVLIVLSRDEYIRNYLETGAFRALEREHELRLLLSGHCRRQDLVEDLPGYLGTLPADPAREKAHYDLFNVLTWRHRKRSRTFHYRFSRFYRTHPWTGPKNVLRNLNGLRQAARYVLLGNRAVAPLAVPRMVARLAPHPELVRRLEAAAPHLVLFPCSAYDPLGNDLARLGPALGFRTMFLVDNWDNLSSKSIFWAAPDFLGVWGEQSRRHAADIHGIAPERVFLLGTPRFESYYELRERKPAAPYPFPYVLFCGSALAFNELEALALLDREIAARPEVYGDLRVVYRPHPQRQARLCPDLFREEDFRRVVLDRQVADAYYRRDARALPSLDYYPALLAGARLVVCPLTTMLVESLICGTPVLALTYDDGVHYTSPHHAYKYYLHFEGIERISGLHLNRAPAELGAELRRLFQSPPALTPDTVDASLEYFIHRDGLSYAERLAGAVRTLERGAATANR